jgi:hypothetical protein
MRLCVTILLLALASCDAKKEMTLTDLEEASWEELDNGMGHFAITKGGSQRSDSIHYTLIGITPEKYFSLSPELFEFTSRWLNEILPAMVNSHLPHSDSGYLRITSFHILGNPAITMTVYLAKEYDSTLISKDLQLLQAINGVDSVTYISSSMAEKRLLQDAGPDLKKEILAKKNSLPASYELLIDRKNANSDSMKVISRQISPLISNVDDIQYPDPRVTDKIIYVKYKRF